MKQLDNSILVQLDYLLGLVLVIRCNVSDGQVTKATEEYVDKHIGQIIIILFLPQYKLSQMFDT